MKQREALDLVSPCGTKVIFGIGSITRLGTIVGTLHQRPRIAIVAGTTGKSLPWPSLLEGRRVEILDCPARYPSPKDVTALRRRLERVGADVVVAAGGGAVLDLAKAAAGAGPRRPLVTVPTTNGSGAEVTPFAALWDFGAQRKTSLAGLAPAAAIVDPQLTCSVPLAGTAASVLDTLAQAVEATWSKRSTPLSRRFALEAIALTAKAGLDLLADLGDVRLRSAVSLAGLYSGNAIAVSQTTVCHALSYPLTLHYGVAHGHACGLMLANAVRFNAAVSAEDCTDRRGVVHVRGAIDAAIAASHQPDATGVGTLVEAILAAGELAELRELAPDAALIARSAMSDQRANNNPRRLDLGALVQLLGTEVTNAG